MNHAPRSVFAAALLLAGALFCPALRAADAPGGVKPFSPDAFDRARLPAALRHVPIERLSSGALLRLDRDGDLVESPEARAQRLKSSPRGPAPAAPAVALDPRVASNIRLGDDPVALPSNMRAQAEPHIARAPNRPDFLLATFQEGRFTNGGAVNCGYSVSLDGGITWMRALIPNLANSSGGSFNRATDPVAAVDLNGVAYLNTLGLRDGPVSDGTILLSRSTDSGATWSAPIVAYQPPNTNVFPDKNWFTINNFPGTPNVGRIVITYTLFSNTNVNAPHPIYRVFSDNGGFSWSAPAPIHSTALEVQGSQPVFLSDGRLAIPYWNFNGTDDFADDFLEVVVSNDGGNSFTAPRFITAVAIYNHPAVRDGAFLPAATADSVGNLHLVYQAIHGGAPRILFMKSANAGLTWTTPLPISDNPASAGVLNPAIAASADGQTLTVVFYDARDNPGSSTLLDLYLAQSFDGGATWQPNIRVSSTSSDATLAPLTGGGYMLGDYQGIAPPIRPHVPAVPVWIDTRTGNPDPFIARIGIEPQFDFASWQAARLSLAQIENPETGGPSGDADSDGADNNTEFQNGTDPNERVVPTARQLNISTRTSVAGGDRVLIAGFIVTGTASKQFIVRGLGPSLTAANIPGAMADPILELVPQTGPTITNDDWQNGDPAAVQATGIPPSDSREAALVVTLPPGNHTVILRSKNDAPGVGLVELYDLNPADDSQFANLSSRGFVGTGDNVMIGGVIVGQGQGPDGAGSTRTALRALGPSLTAQNVSGALPDPVVLVYNPDGDIIGFNDNWQESGQSAELQSNNLAPTDPRESALILTLPKSNYTAVVRGKDGSVGIGLVEAFSLP